MRQRMSEGAEILILEPIESHWRFVEKSEKSASTTQPEIELLSQRACSS